MKNLIYTLSAILFLSFTACQESAPNQNKEKEQPTTENTTDTNNDKTDETDKKAETPRDVQANAFTGSPVLVVNKDGSAFLDADPRNADYSIAGYAKPDLQSKKRLLISVLTAEVENNPSGCDLGAYYDIDGMADAGVEFKKQLGTEGDFAKFELSSNGKSETVYIQKGWIK
jgi:hypothetical protein